MNTPTQQLMKAAPVIPVLVIQDVAHACPLAEALVAGGLPVLEVTLRTPVAMAAMREMQSVEGAIVGVGTAVSAADIEESARQGAAFAVSPGYTRELGAAARDAALPLLPGVMTPGEIMQASADGYRELKFFPAKQAGGIPMLQALAGPFGDVVFCPTGGINADTAPEYLALDNVLCVGGSWVAPPALVRAGRWDEIRELAARSRCPALDRSVCQASSE